MPRMVVGLLEPGEHSPLDRTRRSSQPVRGNDVQDGRSQWGDSALPRCPHLWAVPTCIAGHGGRRAGYGTA